MSRPAVAWYVHHHGSGHLGRLRAVAPHLDADVVALSSLPAPADLPAHVEWVRLDRDDEPDPGTGRRPADADPAAGGLLHWAPLLHPGHRGRFTRIARELDARGAAAVVVDVSVEVTVLARLLGVPPVLVAQPGVRDDEPHALGLRAAARVLAPWPADVVPAPHLDPVRERVVFTGGISRFDGREAAAGDREGVLVLGGRGGSGVTAEHVDAAARATPGHRWTALGAGGTWSDDPWRELAAAGTVVSFAGQNSVADLAVAGARAVVVPQDRPFDEQAVTARALGRAGLAVVEPAWPEPGRWPEVLARAEALDPDWSVWGTAGAAARAAEAIDDVARGRGAR